MSKNNIIKIKDDLDLKKIMDSGQAFRIKVFDDGFFRFICGENILYIKPMDTAGEGSGRSNKNDSRGAKSFEIMTFCGGIKDSSKDAFDGFWAGYFDLDRNYSNIRKSVSSGDMFLSEACRCGEGLRILRQDPWEMLVTFIISQRKSIPAIKDSVERICARYGREVDTGIEKIHLFPSAEEMKNATEEELKDCKLGYRVSYIQDAIKQVSEKNLDLQKIASLDYKNLFEKLKEVRGVGDKVSNCICLFAYAKTEAAPVDTWIAKVIDKYYNGINPFPAYKDSAGIMQQYIFYYALTHKDAF